ncbi:MAG TPA: nucleoside triphosphate pyrophosphatase [Acidimicrobiales bacterium]
MPPRTLVLASGSPARLGLLRAAGFDPIIVVSGVDEDDVDPSDTAGSAGRLAAAKAGAVARPDGDALVVGCDSLLEFDGRPHGKATSIDEARSWLEAMRGRSGTLWTGHCVIDEATGARAEEVVGTTVRFGVTTDAELDAYLATPDVLSVAGAFTLDGRSAPFVDGIDGDPGNVIGLSLPALRRLLCHLGVSVTDLWEDAAR